MTDLPDPPVPAECDLRGLSFLPLDVDRLLESDLFALSTGDEFKAALALWLRSWRAVPAASISPDERVQALRAGVSLTEWRALGEVALRGWIECNDGRLYHPVVAEKALEAWIDRLKFRKRSAAGNSARHGSEYSAEEFDLLIADAKDRISVLKGGWPVRRENRPKILAGGKSAPADDKLGAKSPPARSEKPSGVTGEEKEGRKEDPVASSLRSESTALDPLFDEFEKSRDCTDAEAWRMAVGMFAQRGGLSDRRARQLVGKFAKDFSLSTFEIARAALSTWRSGTHSPEPYFRKAAESAANDRGTSVAAKPRHADAGEYWPVDVQRRWLIELRDNPLAWRPERGPAPGLTGCRVEARLLAEFGYPDPTDPESFA